MIKIRRSHDRLIFIMGIPMLVRMHLYIKTAPGHSEYVFIVVYSVDLRRSYTRMRASRQGFYPHYKIYILFHQFIEIFIYKLTYHDICGTSVCRLVQRRRTIMRCGNTSLLPRPIHFIPVTNELTTGCAWMMCVTGQCAVLQDQIPLYLKTG